MPHASGLPSLRAEDRGRAFWILNPDAAHIQRFAVGHYPGAGNQLSYYQAERCRYFPVISEGCVKNQYGTQGQSKDELGHGQECQAGIYGPLLLSQNAAPHHQTYSVPCGHHFEQLVADAERGRGTLMFFRHMMLYSPAAKRKVFVIICWIKKIWTTNYFQLYILCLQPLAWKLQLLGSRL